MQNSPCVWQLLLNVAVRVDLLVSQNEGKSPSHFGRKRKKSDRLFVVAWFVCVCVWVTVTAMAIFLLFLSLFLFRGRKRPKTRNKGVQDLLVKDKSGQGGHQWTVGYRETALCDIDWMYFETRAFLSFLNGKQKEEEEKTSWSVALRIFLCVENRNKGSLFCDPGAAPSK